jgi:hypothetical protein
MIQIVEQTLAEFMCEIGVLGKLVVKSAPIFALHATLWIILSLLPKKTTS